MRATHRDGVIRVSYNEGDAKSFRAFSERAHAGTRSDVRGSGAFVFNTRGDILEAFGSANTAQQWGGSDWPAFTAGCFKYATMDRAPKKSRSNPARRRR